MGNKVDLERSRQVVSVEGKELARSYDAKFIETSAGLKHNVDELLVGVLKQILLRQEFSEKPLTLKVRYLILRTHFRAIRKAVNKNKIQIVVDFHTF